MIPLRVGIDPLPNIDPVVVRLQAFEGSPGYDSSHDAVLVSHDGSKADFDLSGFTLRVHTNDPANLDGDVVLILPGQRTMHRLIRRSSPHNTFLITEQCDQKCIMCSQPPKKFHVDMFDVFLDAVRLAPNNAMIGLSGGEPLLHKDRLFDFLQRAQIVRPDIGFHILTNGQHLHIADRPVLNNLNLRNILWGIPIYASQSGLHDRIVKKAGAFDRLQESLAFLGSLGATIELRTVVLNSNAEQLEDLAKHVTTHQAFANVWAIMQLENIGFARMNWASEFFDNSISFSSIERAVDVAAGRGLETALYNFPLCTVPMQYRSYCVPSISDWKQKFISGCVSCTMQSTCAGFFEWYPEKEGFSKIRPL